MNIKKILNFIKKLSPYNIQKGLKYLKHFGPKEFLIRLSDRMEPEEVPYGSWYEAHRASEQTLASQRTHSFEKQPLICIVVPLYRTPEQYLREMIESVLAQTYANWELCLADGSGDGVPNYKKSVEALDHTCSKAAKSAGTANHTGSGVSAASSGDDSLCAEAARRHALLAQYAAQDSRIRVRYLEENLGIAGNTNAALAMAGGDYVGLLDHDDLLAPDALYEIAARLQQEVPPELIYTDEDKVDGEGKEHFQPNLKPDFNPDLLRSNNYICHFLVVSKALLERVGGIDRQYDGAQDYDFILRCTEQAQGICHIPRVLYHWRTHAASTADNPLSKEYAYEAGRRAIAAHLERCQLAGEVIRKPDFGFYRVRYEVTGEPLVSIIIPNRDEMETLRKCLESIEKKTKYKNYEIIIIENNSETEEIFAYYKEIDGRKGIHVVYWDREFNYSALNNFGVRHARGDYFVFLNNDMEIISEDWLDEMLGHCMRQGTGIVGARLYYPDDTIQHAGIIVGIGGIAGSLFVGLKRSHSGYLHKESLQQDLSAVTAACMMVSRKVFEAAGGFEEQLAVAFNDVDFCLRVRTLGYLVVYDPYVELYHYESKTRGAEDTPEKVRRFQSEIEFMRTRWISILKDGDPYYNKNFSLAKWNYSLRSNDRTMK
jgi:GT2 family glycosyltransferase